ncbi:MAG: GNAT family protein [Bacteroidota bacterium]
MDRPIKFLEGEKIYLRPYDEKKDLELFQFGKNNSVVRETLFLFRPLSEEAVNNEAREWHNNKENVLFTICEQNSDEPIGETGLFRIDYVSRAATFYIAIYDPQYWGKGYGSEATELLLKYSFDILNLNRVQLHVASNNLKGVKIYEKCGFKIEGTLREAMYHNNEYIDFFVMGILRKDYYKK